MNNAKSIITPGGELYSLHSLDKSYAGPVETLPVLQGIDLAIAQGETLAIMGASGSGKSTLLHILDTLDTPSAGEIFCRGLSLTGLGEEEKVAFRNREIGFVFQFHHLLAEFNTLENVAMQAIIGGMPKKQALAAAARMLDLVGLKDRQKHAVTTLSGGERQRAAIARAMLGEPRVLLADEPTGNLDEKTGRQVADLLLDLNRQFGSTLIIVTHNPEIAGKMQRCLELKDGKLYEKNLKHQ